MTGAQKHVFNTLPQVESIPPQPRGKVAYEVWRGNQVTRNGKVAGRLVVISPQDWLSEEDHQKLRRRAHALKLCSRKQWVQILPTGEEEPGPSIHCHDRLCGICTAARSRRWQERVQWWTTEDGQTQRDGNGKLKGTRTYEEVLAALDATVARLQRTMADDPEALHEEMSRAFGRAEREMQTVTGTLYHHFATLTIPNVRHVWMMGIGRDLLDGYLLQPFRAMMIAVKNRRNRKTKKRHVPVTRRAAWRAIRRARQQQRQHWQWHRPRGRHFLLGLSYLTRMLGYLAALEITHSPKTGYHPHLHLLTWSVRPYLAQGILRHVWRHYTRNPGIQAVKVKKARVASVGKELVKYLTKLEKTKGAAIREIARALYRRRAIWTGGIAYGVRWSKERPDTERMDRLLNPPLAAMGEHILRDWDGVTKGWTDRPLRDDNATMPVKTAEQWANPLTVSPDGERTRRPLAANAADRTIARSTPIAPRSEDEQAKRHAAEKARRHRAAREKTHAVEPNPAARWGFYLVSVIWGLLVDHCGDDDDTAMVERWETGLRAGLHAWAS